MKIRNLFSKNSKKRVPATSINRGRAAHLEQLEDRRVLANYFVYGNGDSIQDAIDNAANNYGPDTIFLKSDDYYQNIYIQDNHPLTIIGLGNVTLNPENSNDIVEIYGSKDVTLKNLTIRNSHDDGIDAEDTYKLSLYNIQSLYNDDDGLYAEDVDYVHIHNSRFNDNYENGIELVNVGYAYLQDVQASYNGDGFVDEVSVAALGLSSDDSEESGGHGIAYYIGGSEVPEPQVAAITDGVPTNGIVYGHLEVFSGDFSNNEVDGILTEGVAIVEVDTVYANNNGQDGIDVEDNSMTSTLLVENGGSGAGYAEQLSINYTATDANWDDGVESNADNVSITEFRAVHNDEEGIDIDDAYDVYIYNVDASYNAEQGIEMDDVGVVNIDYVQANGNGANSDNTGLDIDAVDDLTVHNSQFIANYGDGINIYLNEYGVANLSVIDSSYNTGNGIDLSGGIDNKQTTGYGAAYLDTVNVSYNNYNGIRSSGLKSLSINNTSATYNGYNGLKVLGEGNSIVEESSGGYGGDNGYGYYGTDLNIAWSEFARNYEDGIKVYDVGDVIISQVSSTYNGDDGFDSVHEAKSVDFIDSIFENNWDEDIVYFNF